MKKTVVCGLLLASLMAYALPAAHGAEVAFGDLSGHWAEKSILSMCEGTNPLFKGVGTGEDGLALFAPEKEMTGAEFVTVLVRAYYGDELNNEPIAGAWYSPAWMVAERHGLVNERDTAYQVAAIPRKVMAKIIVKAMIEQGETLEAMALTSSIADYEQIDTEYQNFVRQVYSMGIITGTDQAGTFSPDLTVSRAQGATILNRLVNPGERVEFTYIEPIKSLYAKNPYEGFTTEVYKPAAELQTWNEGEAHSIAQAGDTVIARDGRTVVLEEVDLGNGTKILGFGQGVDIVTGTTINGIAVGKNHWIDQSKFTKSPFNNEVYSATQWDLISKATYPKGLVGNYNGEVYNTYWIWDGATSMWLWTVDD